MVYVTEPPRATPHVDAGLLAGLCVTGAVLATAGLLAVLAASGVPARGAPGEAPTGLPAGRLGWRLCAAGNPSPRRKRPRAAHPAR
jgi:hypothetical protein